MPEEKYYQPQSISISGSTVSGSIGLARRDLIQNQVTADKILVNIDVIEGLEKIEELVQSSNLSDSKKSKAIRYIETAKKKVQSKEPYKNFAATSLQRATEVLKTAD